VDDRLVDVRVAEAIGCTLREEYGSWYCMCPDRYHSRGEGKPRRWMLRSYSSDYAWCGEVAELNSLATRRFHPTGPKHICWDPYGSPPTSVVSDFGWRTAICEWLIAAIAAGVPVRLPGGRVVNG
jgi:hypothetical protein